MTRALAAGLLALFVLVGGASAQAWEAGTDGLVPIPPLSAHVTDITQTLSAAERQALEAKLTDWEARTGGQFAVLLVPSTQPEPIEAYAIRVADAWKIGRKGSDDGVLFVVAKNDRKLRLEVGYGFEGVLTDATSKRIIAETVAPKFREGAFGAGIDAGVDRVISVLAEGKPLPPAKSRSPPASGGGSIPVMVLLLVFVVVPAIGGVLKKLLGRLVGSTVGSGVVGAAAWLFAGSIAIGVIAAIVSFFIMIFAGAGTGLLSGGRRGGGVWIPPGGGGGGWGGGGSGGGGGWSGGGGGFGGGGASGDW
jgi:uncharacterized protein